MLLPAASALHFRGRFALVNPPFQCLSFIGPFLALRHGDLNLGASILKVDGERDAGMSLSGNHPDQAVDFRPIQEELAPAYGIDLQMPLNFGIRRDMTIEEIELLAHGVDETLGEIDAPLANRFDLASLKADARLKPIEEEIIEMGLAIDRDGFHRKKAIDYREQSTEKTVRIRFSSVLCNLLSVLCYLCSVV